VGKAQRAHLTDHGDYRAILIKGDEGAVQIVPLYGALSITGFNRQRWCHTLAADAPDRIYAASRDNLVQE
jgi:hypothetical protein